MDFIFRHMQNNQNQIIASCNCFWRLVLVDNLIKTNIIKVQKRFTMCGKETLFDSKAFHNVGQITLFDSNTFHDVGRETSFDPTFTSGVFVCGEHYD